MILIIAEKPSLARNISSAIGKMKRMNGYHEGNGYIVTWVFGHLFSLADVEYYTGGQVGSRWTIDNLPCFPEKFIYQLRRNEKREIDDGVKAQFDIICALCNRDDVDTIVNAGDSDREGEIIIRTCVENALKNKKAIKRLWLPDQTEETILDGIKNLKDDSEYDNLANEGYARTFIDWLYGVNLTRYATLKSGKLMRVGRVIVPIVKAIYDRDLAIRNFVPDIYYGIVSKEKTSGEEIELLSKEKFSKDEKNKALELCNKYNNEIAIVTDVKKKKDILKPGKLYSLTKLQNVLGKKYKMSMEESLNILQGLYEKGYVTYPRTNSEYLAEAEQDKIKKIIEAVKQIGYPVEFKHKKTIFDDSKIESHSALTPTTKIPKKEHLSDKEYDVYSTIVRRFVAVFCKDNCTCEKTEIKITVGNFEEFILKGTVIITPGWTKFDDYSKKDKFLPVLNKGDEVNIKFSPVEKETSPPKHYTIETLNNYLKNPFREEKANAQNEDDSEEYRAIFEGLELGTEATRTGIIDNARKSGYIMLKKDVYTILKDGENLIESLMRMGISMDKYKTAELGKALKKIYRSEIKISDGVSLAKKEISEVFNKKEESPENDTDNGFMGDYVGKCPLCGGEIKRTTFGYGCSNYKDGCKFLVSGVICGRVISVSNVKKLLIDGETYKISGFISPKSGKMFDAKLKLDGDKTVFDFS
ncbi:MAG: topoisomerase C-terminal repeat-containing protein [Clostridia bacterium]|nr:topoisomerase C-terminal repeat-containing protein [Clostridia bacterium]